MEHKTPAPWCLVAEFADGARLRFDGDTEQAAYNKILDAIPIHGDPLWYDGVTDEQYESGQYYKQIPKPGLHLGHIIISDETETS